MKRVLVVLAVALVAVLTARARFLMEPGIDYLYDASDAIDALGRGDLQGFAAEQPLMGSFSLLLRAPFAWLVFDAQLDTVYFVGALPCVLATAIIGVVLARIAASAGHGIGVQGLVAGLAVLNPITFRALHWGHPEEILGAALCVGAVLAVLREREILGAILLGLAVATKQWAVLAILPVLLAGPRRPVVVAGLAGAIGAALTLPLLVMNAGQFGVVATSVTAQVDYANSTTPWNIWWPLASLGEVPDRGARYLSPEWVPQISRPLIVLVAVPLALWLRRRRDRRRDDALLLLTALFLGRCVLDNWNNEYYHLPFLLSLLAWEVVRRPGLPVLAVSVTALLGLTFFPQHDALFADAIAHAGLSWALYVSWTVPLLAWLVVLLVRPAVLPRALRFAPAEPGGERRAPAPATVLTPRAPAAPVPLPR